MFNLSAKVVTTFERPSLSGLDYDKGDEGDQLPTNVSKNDHDFGHYVFDVTKTCNESHLIASLSDRSIIVYDAQYMTAGQRLLAHADRINSIESSTTTPHLLYSAGSDKRVCVWDLRVMSTSSISNSPLDKLSMPMMQLRCSGEVLSLSVCTGDTLLAAAVDNSVHFYDIRVVGGSSSSSSSSRSSSSSGVGTTVKLLGEYADVHTDLITQIQFNRTKPSILATAAEDGLICMYNTSVDDEEEAVVSILNTDCPVRRFGFFGAEEDGVYCLSTTEMSSFWHFPSAMRVANFPKIREELGADFLVDCFYDRIHDKLSILVGDYNGIGKIAIVEPDSLHLSCELSGGHAASIRTICTTAAHTEVGGGLRIATGGEDARLCVWQRQQQAGEIEMEEARLKEKERGKKRQKTE